MTSDFEPLTFVVGQVYPEPSGAPGEGAVCRLVQGQGLWVLVKLRQPTALEANGYRFGRIDFGVFSDDAKFPWGIMLLGVSTAVGKPMHQEVPMGIVGEQLVRPEAVEDWLEGRANAMHLLLIDADTGVIHAIRQIGLPEDLVERLKSVWAKQIDAGCSLERYNSDLIQLQKRFSPVQLWDASDRYRMPR